MKTNIFKYAVELAASAILMSSCAKEYDNFVATNQDTPKTASTTKENLAAYTKPNKVIVKLSKTLSDNINKQGGDIINATGNGLRSFSADLRAAQTQSIHRLFPEDKRFIERYKKEGLDQWFVITLENKNSKLRAYTDIQKDLKDIHGIEHMEPVYRIQSIDNGKPEVINNLRATNNDDLETVKAAYFNDKLLPAQWHYNNTGEMKGAVRGADINVYEAWKITTGDPKVIVDIVDGGIDTEHEDLKANLWVNEAEQNGTPGVDDDKNGVIDDIHGWNFVANTKNIIPHLHGTHVAGTVGAVNNNGIGVCGVAGGNGTPNTGIRLMSSQIFEPSAFQQGQDKGTDNLPAAIVYGANNGAVISQNSWGFRDPEMKETPEPIRLAIDYFIKHAGTDSQGKQVGPMKGGVVIFAAGNDYVDKEDFPSSYPPVVAVAAMAPNFRRAGYSTHGNWVDVTAPGGDANMIPNIVRREYQVLSTLPGNKYGYLDGTSMACPHVSGVAALIVSKFGGPGFTNDKLKEMLLKGTEDIYTDNADKIGKLGVGYIDAGKALKSDMHFAPDPVKDLKIVGDVSRLTVEWNTVEDKDDDFAFWYYVCASKNKFTSVPDLKNPPAGVYIQKVRGPRGKKTAMQGQSAPLPIGESLHITVIAQDRWGNTSELGKDIEGVVKNGNPVISMVDLQKPIHITGTENADITFKYKDPDNDPMQISLEGETSTLTFKNKKDNEVTIHITTGDLKAGKYTAYFVVKDSHYKEGADENDPHNGKSKYAFTFEIYDNSDPVVSKPIDFINLSYGSQKRIFLDRHFTDPDGHYLSYTLEETPDPEMALTAFHGSYIDITALKKGVTHMKVKVEDTQKGVLEKDIQIVISNSKILYNITPMVVDDYMEIFLNEELKGLTRITIYDTYGQKMLKRVVNMEYDKTIKLDLREWAAGSYIVNIENAVGSEKVTILKK